MSDELSQGDESLKAVVEKVANALQTALILSQALLLAYRVRYGASGLPEEAIALHAAVDRAARALATLKADGGVQ